MDEVQALDQASRSLQVQALPFPLPLLAHCASVRLVSSEVLEQDLCAAVPLTLPAPAWPSGPRSAPPLVEPSPPVLSEVTDSLMSFQSLTFFQGPDSSTW